MAQGDINVKYDPVVNDRPGQLVENRHRKLIKMNLINCVSENVQNF